MMIAPILLLKRANTPPLVIHKGEVIFYRRGGGSTGFYSGGGWLDGFLSRTEGEINRHQQSTVEIRL